MDEVRSLLTAYVTEDEPPIGLSGAAVLAAARRSRRQHLLTAVVAVAVIVPALGLAVVVLPRRGEVANAPCPAASDTRAALVDRLSCVVGRAVRSLLPPDAQITRLTIPGETPPADPFHLIADPAGDAPRDALVHMGVRVTDSRGSGSVYLLIVPSRNSGGPPCEERGEILCRTEPAPQGLLWLSTLRSGDMPRQRPEPTLTLEQVRQPALTPGLEI
ncbi:hypothetical protein Q5425_36635 [Amycolatopsis sp. A133]|uniref:hypothetical protein n=1 Tax=Amycolatopsis sp. A133 TaxID=3064472 RepID=UPI0027FD205F|nr:hypothetical protein [Amycolatopsis sp. A133]MDQ7809284.1 hypothetical protein [Amycolatopsis sp. A133]